MENTLYQEQRTQERKNAYDRVAEVSVDNQLLIDGQRMKGYGQDRKLAYYFTGLINAIKDQPYQRNKVAVAVREHDGLSIVVQNLKTTDRMIEFRAKPDADTGYQASLYFHKGRGDDKEVVRQDIFPKDINNDSVERAYCKRAMSDAREHLGLE